MTTNVITAYVVALVIMIVFFLLAVVISNNIPYVKGASDKLRRRVWFWVLAVLTPVISIIYNASFIMPSIRIPSMRNAYFAQSCIAAGAAFLLFVLVGLLLSKSFSHSKISSWF